MSSRHAVSASSCSARAVGIVTVVAHQVLVLVGNTVVPREAGMAPCEHAVCESGIEHALSAQSLLRGLGAVPGITRTDVIESGY